jgi:prepilin-type N-terminal cleavage/methylation domain-containing protein
MNGARFDRRGRAFTLIELLIVITILVLLVGILLPSLGKMRGLGRKSICFSNMRQFGIAFSNYGTDFRDRLSSFTWRAGIDYGFGGVAGLDNTAAANQAVDIMRRRAERTDMMPIGGWIPHVLYSHLVLNDFLQQRLPEPMVACPEDRVRLLWQASEPIGANDNGAGYFALAERPLPGVNSPDQKRWPYSSSYQIIPAAYSPDSAINGVPTVQQDGMGHRWYDVGNGQTRLGRRKISDISFPNGKTAMFDGYEHHSGPKGSFYAYDQATEPILLWDGSVNDRKMTQCNPGFQPNSPASTGHTVILYVPEASWEPPCRNGASQQTVTGHCQWTREGLHGLDFGSDGTTHGEVWLHGNPPP